ncbi:methyltransferase [Sphingomonas sp.]|jgi:methylase of polypeptide subunit release factors|uniref:methyltransferase n=1 Tax=Sphingomonas sp. TaxID=28214 RepID=UPI002DE43D2C|nr:methyltransferase [Sphingomonas sp.]HEV2567469.1 methyltransferase [Sphingomonas sp.]
MSESANTALLSLLKLLKVRAYQFVTPTPASHARVLDRPDMKEARDLRGLLGWSLPARSGLDASVEDLLRQAGMLEEADGQVKSRLRVSSLANQLWLHSAYPTEAEDSVFFGPDTYRFANLIAAELARQPLAPGAHIVDMGAGAGVGGIVAGLCSEGARVTLTDLNPKALRLARINAAAAGIDVETVESDTLDEVEDPIDLAVINPPYIIDDGERAYRDGGGMHGGEIPLKMTRMAAERLAPGGRLILYSGAAIVGGRNALCEAVAALAEELGLEHACRELDPDVFGEELEKPAYADVERIALVAVTMERSA